VSAKTIAIASDHAGYRLKALLCAELADRGYEPLDLGTDSEESVDYPDFAAALVAALDDGRASRGILVCGSGIGISMAANRHKGIRAAPCFSEEAARLSRQHNDANVLALGARLIDEDTAKRCVKVFLETAFEGGRHARRVGKLDAVGAG
jgi:ribose 5-phosphate isomerase B